MALIKRGEVYWVDFVVGGKRTRRSTGTSDRKAGQEYHDKLKAQLWRHSKLGERKEHSWESAAVRWLKENAGKKDYKGDREKVAFFNEHFAGKLLSEIDADAIYEAVEKHKADASGATRNRYLALIRAIMRRASREWGWIDAGQVPFVRMHKESKGRTRYLEPEEFKRLMLELPEHWRSVVGFAVATGLRASNVVKLRWREVDLERSHVIIGGDSTKNGEDLGVPLNEFASGILRREKGKHGEFVFTMPNGKPVGTLRGDMWKGALKRAGIEDFRFHDLRHTFASWLIQSGASENFVQQMGGWKTAAMVKRYATLRSKHLALTAGLIDKMVPADLMLTVASQ